MQCKEYYVGSGLEYTILEIYEGKKSFKLPLRNLRTTPNLISRSSSVIDPFDSPKLAQNSLRFIAIRHVYCKYIDTSNFSLYIFIDYCRIVSLFVIVEPSARVFLFITALRYSVLISFVCFLSFLIQSI